MSLPAPLLLGYHLYSEPHPWLVGSRAGFEGWGLRKGPRGSPRPSEQGSAQVGAQGWQNVGEKAARAWQEPGGTAESSKPALSVISKEASFGEGGQRRP